MWISKSMGSVKAVMRERLKSCKSQESKRAKAKNKKEKEPSALANNFFVKMVMNIANPD